MTDTAWKPRAGVDAMTRDGRKAKPSGTGPDGRLLGTVNGMPQAWRADGIQLFGYSKLDLVSDWPDADPLPDADGWEPKVGDRVKLVKDGLSTVGAVGMEGVIKKIEGGQHPYLIELDEGLVYESYAVPEQYRLTRADRDYFVSAVRPAPSGPVVEETVKRIVPPEMTLRDWFAGQALAGLLAGSHKMPGDSPASRAEERVVEAYAHADAMIRVKQGDEAMEGK